MDRPVIGISINYMQLGSYHQFHVRDKYIDAVYNGGALPLPIPCTEDKSALRQYLDIVGALVIIGGLDYPPSLYGQEPHPKTEIAHERRAKGDYALLETALEMKTPVLGICAGMQLMNIFFGGKLIQHIGNLDAHFGEKYHQVKILGGRWLPLMLNKEEVLVNSNHHQAVDPEHIGKGLTVVARADDGMVEALEYESDTMVLGIQWHPERITDPELSRAHFDFLNRLAGNRTH
jgi:putative glutamine amidotransferase